MYSTDLYFIITDELWTKTLSLSLFLYNLSIFSYLFVCLFFLTVVPFCLWFFVHIFLPSFSRSISFLSVSHCAILFLSFCHSVIFFVFILLSSALSFLAISPSWLFIHFPSLSPYPSVSLPFCLSIAYSHHFYVSLSFTLSRYLFVYNLFSLSLGLSITHTYFLSQRSVYFCSLLA